MASPLQHIGDPPGMEPEPERGPCAVCKAQGAAQLAHEALTMITDAQEFPVEHTRKFLDAHGHLFVNMAADLYEYGYAEAKKQDNEFCPQHRPSKGDDE